MMTAVAPVAISMTPAQKSRLLRNSSCMEVRYLHRPHPEERPKAASRRRGRPGLGRPHASRRIAVAMLRNMGPGECVTSGGKQLLRFDPALFHHQFPLLHLADHEGAELGR